MGKPASVVCRFAHGGESSSSRNGWIDWTAGDAPDVQRSENGLRRMSPELRMSPPPVATGNKIPTTVPHAHFSRLYALISKLIQRRKKRKKTGWFI